MLCTLLVLPILAMVIIYTIPLEASGLNRSYASGRSSRTILLVALIYSALNLMQTYHLMLLFDNSNASLFQFQELGGLIAIDGISL
ncbi:hypothetical protein HK100_010355, partial [Physocladia obscura]